MTDPILKVNGPDELNDFLQLERERAEVARLMKSPNPMARVTLCHQWGLGDCPGCSACGE